MIYIIPVEDKYYQLPKINPFCAHSPGYNCETDFHDYIKNSPLVTDDSNKADWHYLPLYWSYWQLSHKYGTVGREEMTKYLNKIIIDPSKTFTVSEADEEPNFGINIRVFSGNTNKYNWTPIPILTLPHKPPKVQPEKKYLASFVGNINGWPFRISMKETLKDREFVKIIQSKKGEDLFVNTILESYTTLCPRGSAESSYRFYESMQLGVVPILISNTDIRPFKNKIPWDDFSYYIDSPLKLNSVIDYISSLNPQSLIERGEIAKSYWSLLFYQGWCRMVIESL